MQRRNFIKNSLLTSAGLIGGATIASASSSVSNKTPFKLNYAPHFGMFKNLAGGDLLAELQVMYDSGFRALEDNGMAGRPKEEQEKIAQKMAKLGMKMGVFVAHKIYWQEPNLASGNAAKREEFLQNIKDAVEVAKRVNAKWMTVVPGHVDLKLEMGYQTAHVVESLKQASKILEPHGLIMVLEPLNWWTDHAGQFLSKIPQAYEICKAVDSPSCKILFDIYHQQITEGNIIPNFEKAWSEVAYVQIGDNPGRKEPTTGEINYKNIFKYLHEKGFQGILGMEHGNSKAGKEGEQAVIDAYRAVDSF
jgi:hydroxypyruvate isomerase